MLAWKCIYLNCFTVWGQAAVSSDAGVRPLDNGSLDRRVTLCITVPCLYLHHGPFSPVPSLTSSGPASRTIFGCYARTCCRFSFSQPRLPRSARGSSGARRFGFLHSGFAILSFFPRG